MDKINGNAREMIGDSNSSFRSGNFVRVGGERTSPISYAGLMIGFEYTVD